MNSFTPLMVTTPTTLTSLPDGLHSTARRLQCRVRQWALRRVTGERDRRGSGILSGAVHRRLDRGELPDVTGTRRVRHLVSVESICAPVAGSNASRRCR